MVWIFPFQSCSQTFDLANCAKFNLQVSTFTFDGVLQVAIHFLRYWNGSIVIIHEC